MTVRGRHSKHRIIVGFLAVMGSILLVRLFLLTVVEHDRWDDYADDVSSRAVYETAPRGDILDRNGKKLATSKAVYSINLSRVNLSEEDALAASAEVFKVLKANDEDIETTQEEVSKTLEKKIIRHIFLSHFLVRCPEKVRWRSWENSSREFRSLSITSESIRTALWRPMCWDIWDRSQRKR